MKRITAVLLLIIILAGCAPDARFKFKNPATPEDLNDGFIIGTPADVGIEQQKLDTIYNSFVSESKYHNALSLLILKDGKLIFETYTRDTDDRERFNHIQSATKSITSLAFGMAKAEGYFDSVNQTLYSIIPEKFPAENKKKQITLRHLLTMTSGINFDNDVFSVEMYTDKPSDPASYILNKSMYADPGVEFYYRDADPHLISFAIQTKTGMSQEEWVRNKIFSSLDITNYYWDYGHTGITMGAHGLHLRARDMLKIGLLVLNRGVWNGSQIVDSTWIAESTKKQFTVPDEYQKVGHEFHYGYYWWTVPKWNAYSAWGRGGNFIFIMPEKKLIVVMTSLSDVDEDVLGTKLNHLVELIEPLLE